MARTFLITLAATSMRVVADYWDGQCTACPAQLYKHQHCLKGGTLLGERGCGLAKAMCEARCSEPDSSPAAQPENLYWDGSCTPCPSHLYKDQHCLQGGVLVGERACGAAGAYCEGHCTKPAATSPRAEFYWDGQCLACPSMLYKDQHCLQGGDLVGERACGFAGLYCEGKCRKSQASQAPQPTLYWDNVCSPCPASLYTHCPKGGKLVGERSCGPLKVHCEGRCELPAASPQPADWIIIGAGASGSAAAAALADAGESVLVLERGKSDLDLPETQSADTWPSVVNTEAAEMIRWSDGSWGAVANVLGGGTEINGGLFIEEEPDFLVDSFGQDFDLEAFYASSKLLADNLSAPLRKSTYGESFSEALVELGLGTEDPKPSLRMKRNGSWIAQATINTSAPGWPRRGAAVLLYERSGLKNLRFVTQFQVQKINFEGKRAVSVSARNPQGATTTMKAIKGVILAAGAVYTPQVLQVSGIGDQALLRSLGVETMVDNSAVGQNFVDRNLLNFAAWSGKREPLFIGYSMASSAELNLTLENEGWGKVASAFAISSLGLQAPAQRTQALRDFLKPLLEGPISDIMDNMIQFVALQHHTFSRGSVEAQSQDGLQPPKVIANKLADVRDLENQLLAMKTLSSLIDATPIQAFVDPQTYKGTSEELPVYLSCVQHASSKTAKAVILPCLPRDDASKEDYFDYFRKNVVSSYHYFGTASFGTVVEGTDFRVKGTDNLHVVDASVLPNPTRVNPQGTIMAMGHYVGTKLAEKKRRLDEDGTNGEIHV